MKTNRIMDHRTIPISTNENIHIFQRKLKLFYELGGKRNWAEVYCGDLIFFRMTSPIPNCLCLPF